MNEIKIGSENLAYWYLRLNGFFTITNFVVHPDYGSEQRTDVDILGIRFPYRAEQLENSMEDDVYFTSEKDHPFFVITEVKKDVCKLNGPWTKKEDENIQRVLQATGLFKKEKITEVSSAIYKKGFYENETFKTSLLCIGKKENIDLKRKFPDVSQIEFKHILSFIFKRFNKYEVNKMAHKQWDETGINLWNLYMNNKIESKFIEQTLNLIE